MLALSLRAPPPEARLQPLPTIISGSPCDCSGQSLTGACPTLLPSDGCPGSACSQAPRCLRPSLRALLQPDQASPSICEAAQPDCPLAAMGLASTVREDSRDQRESSLGKKVGVAFTLPTMSPRMLKESISISQALLSGL